jgi:hypothetical protein
MTLSDAFNTRSPVDSGSHRDENEAEEDGCKLDVPVAKKRGRESHVATESSRKPERACDTPESSAAVEPPLLSDKVKDGLKDMLHALSRLGGGQAVLLSQNQPTGVKSVEVAEKDAVLVASTATAVVAPVEDKVGQGKAVPVQHPGEEVTDGSCEGKSLIYCCHSTGAVLSFILFLIVGECILLLYVRNKTQILCLCSNQIYFAYNYIHYMFQPTWAILR